MPSAYECLSLQCGGSEAYFGQGYACAAAGYVGVRSCGDPACNGFGWCSGAWSNWPANPPKGPGSLFFNDFQPFNGLEASVSGKGCGCGCGGGSGSPGGASGGGGGAFGIPGATMAPLGFNASLSEGGASFLAEGSWFWVLVAVGVLIVARKRK